MNVAREETTEERVDPELVAARSFQIEEERDVSSVATAAGVPGAVGTLEGADTSTTTKDGVMRRSETRNFEISKTVRRNVAPVGRLSRLSIAVVVDGTYTGKGDKRKFVPRSAAELAVIRNVVAAAAGIQDARGDKVTVECVPFAEQPLEVAETAPTGVEAIVRKNWPYAAAGAGVLLLLAVGGTVVALRRKKKVEPPPTLDVRLGAERPPELAGGDLAALPQDQVTAVAAQLRAPQVTPDPTLTADAQVEAERIRALTAELASNDPYLAARVVRAWLTEGNSEEEAA